VSAVEGVIYLDYNATTPVDARVLEAMLPYFSSHFANASSTHELGLEAHAALDRARSQVAAAIGCRPAEIVFTGGGSESNNLAIKGTVFPMLAERPHVISTAVEHSAVLNTLKYLERRFEVQVTFLPVDKWGLVDPEDVRRALRPETVLVTIMLANNEVGTLQPLPDIAPITRQAGITFHTDAAQALGKIPVNVAELGVDLLTIAGHKFYGPKGIGALYVRQGIRLDSLIHGSNQEHGLRAGTENVPSIVGLGVAAEVASGMLEREGPRLMNLRDRLHDRLACAVPQLKLNGHPERRLPNTVNVSFPEIVNQSLLAYAPQVAASTGSACHSSMSEPSSVLLAMGLTPEEATGAVRLSVGRWSTEEDVDQAAEALAQAYEMVALSPLTVQG
jgi:cysteine desulfurase